MGKWGVYRISGLGNQFLPSLYEIEGLILGLSSALEKAVSPSPIYDPISIFGEAFVGNCHSDLTWSQLSCC